MKRTYSQRGAKRMTRYDDNPVQYAMFGMDYGGHPVVASNVTNDDAAAMAESRELNGYHLVPLAPKRNSRGTISYIRVDDHYEIWEMYFWLEANYKHAHWRPEDVTTARKAERDRRG
jgi:hypothetical protein